MYKNHVISIFHENSQLCSKQISFYQTKIMKIHFSIKDEKHKNSFFILKNKLLGICMIYPKLTICIHIPNIKRVYDMICMKARDSRDIHVYLLVLTKNTIYMK